MAEQAVEVIREVAVAVVVLRRLILPLPLAKHLQCGLELLVQLPQLIMREVTEAAILLFCGAPLSWPRLAVAVAVAAIMLPEEVAVVVREAVLVV